MVQQKENFVFKKGFVTLLHFSYGSQAPQKTFLRTLSNSSIKYLIINRNYYNEIISDIIHFQNEILKHINLFVIDSNEFTGTQLKILSSFFGDSLREKSLLIIHNSEDTKPFEVFESAFGYVSLNDDELIEMNGLDSDFISLIYDRNNREILNENKAFKEADTNGSQITLKENIGLTKNIRKGAVISYISIIFDILVNFFLLRLLTQKLGMNYGLYTLSLSIIGVFLVDFGLSQTITRFLVKYRIDGDKKSENDLLGVFLKIYLIIDVSIMIIASIVFVFLPSIYTGLTQAELDIFSKAYLIILMYTFISIPLLPLNGILSAYEEFSTLKIVAIIQKAFSAILLIIALMSGLGLVAAVLANVVSSLLASGIKLFIVFKRNKIRPNIRSKNKKIVKEIVGFTLWIAISSIASRISLSAMSSILASVSDTTQVSVFGIAVTLETYIYIFSTAISGLFLPKVSNLVHNGKLNELNLLSNKVGKVQLFLSGLFLSVFIVAGKGFLNLYLDPVFVNAYLPTVLLIICVVITAPLLIPETMALSTGAIKYAAIIEICVSLLRLIICYFAAKYYGIIGLSIVFTAGTLIINALKMYFVYYKRQKINIVNFLKNTYIRFLTPFCLYFIFALILFKIVGVATWSSLIVLCGLLSVVYVILTFLILFTRAEKKEFTKILTDKFSFIFKKIKFSNHRDQKSNTPIIWCAILVILSFLSSNYPIDNVSLLCMLIFFSISIVLYVYYVFPFTKRGKGFYLKFLFKSPGLAFVLLFSISAIFTFFATKSFESIFGILKIMLYIWSGFLFTEIFSFKTFLNWFRNIFLVLCVASLLFSTLIFLYGGNFSPILHKGTYYNYFFIFFTINGLDLFARNTGIFWEPGILATFCLIALIFQILFDRRNWHKQIIYYAVYFITLLSTGSLAGYILLLALFPLLLYKINNKYFKFSSWILLGLIIVGLLLFVPLYDLVARIFPFIISKGQSLTSRIFALSVDLQIFTMSPIFGVGNKYQILFQDISSRYYPGLIDTSLNTFGFYLGYFGIGGVLFIIYYSFSLITNKELLWFDKAYLMLIGVLILSKEPHTFSLLTFIFLFYLSKDLDIFSFKELADNKIGLTIYDKRKEGVNKNV